MGVFPSWPLTSNPTDISVSRGTEWTEFLSIRYGENVNIDGTETITSTGFKYIWCCHTAGPWMFYECGCSSVRSWNHITPPPLHGPLNLFPHVVGPLRSSHINNDMRFAKGYSQFISRREGNLLSTHFTIKSSNSWNEMPLHVCVCVYINKEINTKIYY